MKRTLETTPETSSKVNVTLAPVVKRSCSRTTEFRHNPELRTETLDVNKSYLWRLYKEIKIFEKNRTINQGLEIVDENLTLWHRERSIELFGVIHRIKEIDIPPMPDMNRIYIAEEWDEYYAAKAELHGCEVDIEHLTEERCMINECQYELKKIMFDRYK